jgi:Na+/H+ antiporter NhaD/arsenite permease-like protein
MRFQRASAVCAGVAIGFLTMNGAALAAGVAAPKLDGAKLGAIWILPFVGILLSIAILPLATPTFWHHHFGKVAAFWGLAFFIPFTILSGVSLALYEALHTLFLEYLPFLILLFALFVVAGGIRITGSLRGSPEVNVLILLIGTLLASIMGTTGASMLLIRPIIRANEWRKNQAHVVVFFIFLVSNIGGSLTPLGDPPLFLGFLKGVDFFWTTVRLFPETGFLTVTLLAIFYGLDRWLIRTELPPADANKKQAIGVEGGVNFAMLGAIVLAVLMSGVWQPGPIFAVYHVEIELQNLVRDVLLLAIAYASWRLTRIETRQGNAFTWGPILEVAKLFAGIFATIIPAIAILRAGERGALASVVALVTDRNGEPIPAMYFWLSGILSSFLDNAPTYLVFFNLAGGDAERLMGPLASVLIGISAGSVFMGANTYIGNAPNFMVKAIAEERGVKMPSFFGYMAWSIGILVPLFALNTLIFF